MSAGLLKKREMRTQECGVKKKKNKLGSSVGGTRVLLHRHYPDDDERTILSFHSPNSFVLDHPTRKEKKSFTCIYGL
ncbi:Uncharacterized protein APZ42_018593 [Daphnia magna]|uniref:Uncharacterized protein n=1 Tax=Daphnia magna TaxID=35525 RepID=A0A164YZR6_9CRUS|nr:Uncharacterized protein APZ42_018593 [Daphnia magna]